MDQNIDFTSHTIKGNDICKTLKNNGFKGVILMRSGNDTEEEINYYKNFRADGSLSKTTNIKDTIDIIKTKWLSVAFNRI